MNSLIESFVKIAFWFKIFISPFLLGVIAGGFIWLKYQNIYGEILGGLLVLIGIVGGVLFAEKWRKKKGTVEFMTRNSSTTANNFKDKE